MKRYVAITLLMVLMCVSSAYGGAKSQAVREAAEYVFGRFGKEVGEESVETLTEKIGAYSAKYGDDAIVAIKRVGPRGFQVIDDAGENAPAVITLLNRYGNDAVWVASKPRKLAIFVKHGDEAAEAMIKHPGIAAPVIEKFGKPAAEAITKVSSQNARRIGMMADDGSLAAAGQADGLLGVIGKHGDTAADFIWKHKGALAVAVTATAFIADPQPFIDGTRDLAEIAVKPITEGTKEITRGVAAGTNWTLVIVAFAGVIGLLSLVAFFTVFGPRLQRYRLRDAR